MSSALVAPAPQTVADLAERKRLFMSLIVKGGNADQIALALGICDRYGFDPLLKHVVLISGQIYVTRDGLIHHAHQTGQLAGIEEREAVRERDGKWRVTVAVYRKGYDRAFVATAFQSEHENPGSSVWQKAPYRLTVKCATVAALRLAFDISLGAAEEIGYDERGTRTNIGEARFIEPSAPGPQVVEAGMPEQDFLAYLAEIDAMADDGIASRAILVYLQEHDPQLDTAQRAIVQGWWKGIIAARKAGQATEATPAPATIADAPPWDADATATAAPALNWTDFWAWAKPRGLDGRAALDERLGRSTSGMTPLAIKEAIEALPAGAAAPVEASFVEVVGPPAQGPADDGPKGAQPATDAQLLAIQSLATQRGLSQATVLEGIKTLFPGGPTTMRQLTRVQAGQVIDDIRRNHPPVATAAS